MLPASFHRLLLFAVWLVAPLSVAGGFTPPSARSRAAIATLRGGNTEHVSPQPPQPSAASTTTMLSLFRSAAVRAGMQSASIMTVADIVTQLVVEKRSLLAGPAENEDKVHAGQEVAARRHYDPIRTMRWATVGLTLHGPYFRYCFAKLDHMFAGTAQSLVVVAQKTALAQFLVFPPYLVALFTAMGVMEGSDDLARKVRTNVPKAFMSGCIFWPVANIFNFALVPSTARVPYLASVGALWNGYLSWMNSKK